MSRTLEYIALILICGGLTIWGATWLGNQISSSMNNTAELISHPS